jgi:hypothetical protein
LLNPVTQEISDACHVLFGPHIRVSSDFIHSLNPEGLRSAFKKKALETHPDRAWVLKQDIAQLNERFKMVSEAYSRLSSILDKIPDPRQNSARTRGANVKSLKTNSGKGFASHFYSGQMPQWHLLLGRFLYYSGQISWDTLIKAITWQRLQRPVIGQLAFKTGILDCDGIERIIRLRKIGERFGECALRLGFLNSSQLKILLKRQAGMQQPIGTYFIEKGFLTPAALANTLKRQRIHNLQVAFKKHR